MVIMAVALTALCAVLALAIDSGLTSARYQSLQGAAGAAAEAGAYTVYGVRTNASGATDAAVWKTMVGALTNAGLTVKNDAGSGVSTAAPADACDAGYKINEVALAAVYLDAQNNPIPAGSPAVVGGGTLPAGAWGVQITALKACQPAAFGGVIGHPRYPISIGSSAGQPLQGATNTPTITPTPTNTAAATATNTPTATSTSTQTPAPTATPGPFGASGAPSGNCSGGTNPTPNATPAATSNEFYCPGSYSIGSTVTVYANGVGLGNNYGHDSSFKGYIGGGSYVVNQQGSVSTGGGNNAPSSCPAQMTVAIISGVDHGANTDKFVYIGTIVINITQCGNPTTGTIAAVISDPYGIVNLPAATSTPTSTATPTPTNTPTYTPTNTPTSTPTNTPTATATFTGPVVPGG